MTKDSDKEFNAIRPALGANPKAAEEWRKQCLAKASRFKGGRKNEDVAGVHDSESFLLAGGMRAIEYVAGIQAADTAIKFERECWLQVCTDPFPTDYLKSEIERLRTLPGSARAHRGTACQDAGTSAQTPAEPTQARFLGRIVGQVDVRFGQPFEGAG